MLGEVPVAFVRVAQPIPNIEQIILAACRQQLADFKAPRAVHLVEDFPRITIGKIDKKVLEAWEGGS